MKYNTQQPAANFPVFEFFETSQLRLNSISLDQDYLFFLFLATNTDNQSIDNTAVYFVSLESLPNLHGFTSNILYDFTA